MALKDVREKLDRLLRELSGADENSAQSILARQAEQLDSVLVLRLVLAIEREFGVVVMDEEIRPEAFADLDALAMLVQGKLTR